MHSRTLNSEKCGIRLFAYNVFNGLYFILYFIPLFNLNCLSLEFRLDVMTAILKYKTGEFEQTEMTPLCKDFITFTPGIHKYHHHCDYTRNREILFRFLTMSGGQELHPGTASWRELK
jgi:hypothetical protein